MPVTTVDLNGIKLAIKTQLDTANTATGDPIDLSQSMAKRVVSILRVQPEKIPIQPSQYPCVTMFYSAKQVRLDTIAKSMLLGRRIADIELTLVGFVWQDTGVQTKETEDLADNEVENLMENVEGVLRNEPTLGGKCLHSYVSGTTYHKFPVAEGAHMRAGVTSFKIKVQY